MTSVRFSVARDFSSTPGPRAPQEGPFSGELLLQELIPLFEAAMRGGSTLEVDLDGTAGYATSFLEAAFGGLARRFGAAEVLTRLVLVSSEEPYLVDEIRGYIGDVGEAGR